VSGDIPVDEKKTETVAKPPVLTASISYDCYLPEKPKAKEAQPQSEVAPKKGGVTALVQECYAPAKAQDVCPRDDRYEHHSIKDLHEKATDHAKVLSNLHTRMEEAKNRDAVERAKMARLAALVLKDLSPNVTALGCSAERRKAYATAEIQKGIESGNIDLSKISARIKFETDKGDFDVKCGSRKLTFSTAEGSVHYEVKDGQLVETRSGVERHVGSVSSRESYIFRDGQLQKIDPSQSCGSNEGPVFQLGGDGNRLNTSICTSGSKASVDRVGGHKTTVLIGENAKLLAELEKKIKDAEGSGCGKDIDPDHGTCNGDGKGLPRGDSSGNGSSADNASPKGDSGYARDVAEDAVRNHLGNSSLGNSTPRWEPETHLGSTARMLVTDAPIRVSAEQRAMQPSGAQQQIKQSVEQQQAAQQLPQQLTMRSAEKVIPQPSVNFQQAIRSSEIYPVTKAVDAVAQTRPVQVEPAFAQSPQSAQQLKPGVAGSSLAEKALPNVQLTDSGKLQTPVSQQQLLQPGYKAVFNNPIPAVTQPMNPIQNPQMFNSLAKPSVPGADPVAKPVIAPNQMFRPATANPMEKIANGNGSLNSFGKTQNELQDISKAATKNSPLASTRHADLVADQAPSAHTRVSDRWIGIRAVSGGGSAGTSVGGGEAVPFVPIAGKIGGAGSAIGPRIENTKVPGTKPDNKTADGIRTHPVGNGLDSGKKVEDVKQTDGTKPYPVSGSGDGGKKSDGDKVLPVVSSGKFAGRGESVKADKVETDKENEDTATQSQDPGFGYTPRRRPYTVKQGETLESIAIQRWGDERLAELIRMINLHRLNVIKEGDKAVLKLAAGDIVWLPSPVEAERFKKVCDIKGHGPNPLTVGFPV
jgi:hypothetical protein